ncbi:MAG: acyl-[acyl-carrier-protein] thioesterase [Lachnospiraceae bacterium]|nr:acyl-[acyl-carrier-protein] thioesterase [Lachnospiraceae bacterium]
MYAFDSRIRYSETDSEGELTLNALLNYFQDCSTFHSEDVGLGIGYMKEIGQAWVLSSWQIVVDRYPRLGEKVKIVTLPYELKGFLGYRNFAMLDEEGNYLAKANSLWSLLDMTTGKPVAVNAAMHKGYGIDEKLDMDYAPRKITVPEGGQLLEPIVVKKHHLDTNHHVNNGQYVNIAMEYLPDDFLIHQMRAEYKKQAFLDDVLYPYIVSVEIGYVVSLRDEEGRPYVSVEFLQQ